MIVQIKIVGKNKWDNSTRVIISDGHGWTYVGGINKDLDNTINGREITYFRISLNDHGMIEVGDEATELEWKNQ